MNNHFDTIIDSYLQHQVGIDELFLTQTLAEGMQQHIRQLEKDNSFVNAGIGNRAALQYQDQTRGDRIYWLDKSHENPFELEFLSRIDDFIFYLNSTCYTGINYCEFHYALYDSGSFYKRHIDQFRDDPNRKFSLISYLNEDWLEEDGGQLLVYGEDEVSSISPASRKAVFFKSDEMEHEVVATNRKRMSVTGWLKQI